MAAALMSVAMMAGDNDLLWDYSEAKIPTSGPDRDLYYGAYVNDAPSTNLGLNGVKMNSSGYAYFTKAAVAGKLKLTFGPRKEGGKIALMVHTWAGETPAAETKITETAQVEQLQTVVIDLTEAQNNIYITRTSSSAEGVLQKIQFVENVARTFVDFEMIMCNMSADYDFATLPTGVTANGTFNSDQHGYRNFTITVPVDGTVKFTIGDCQYGNQPIAVKNSAGETIATLTYPQAGCYKNDDNNKDNVFTYIYMGEADVLTFGPIQYCNYFKAEATDIMPCEITFKDQNGTILGKVDTYEGANLETIPYTVDDLPAIEEGNAFRGWFYMNNKKAKIGDAITGNTTIQAKVTPIETVTVGSVQTYDFADVTFYPEDHETVLVNDGAWHDATHGWYFGQNGKIDVQVAGKAIVVVTLCKYSESGDVKVMAGEQELATYAVVKNETPDGTELSAQYAGEAGWLTINWTAKQYIHKVVVYNVLDFVEKDENTGYYMVPANDAASFLMALVQANKEGNAKIFLPNGTYDLGETVLTAISGNNISIIGQSMEGVIIKNAPDYKTESIDKTATLKINKNVQGTYLQDLTIQNALDYYKNNNGRAVCLWDQGTKTVCKNVRMLSYQDTYYSNLVGAVKYFEDCEIHGTVDFICGDGSVYFYGTELVCEQRSTSGGGSDALTASNADASDKGYVFDHCTVRYADGIQGTLPVVSFGRSWNNKPKTVFLYTFLDDSNGVLNMTKEASADKDKIERWTLGAMNALPELFGEYYSVNAAGENITPASNNVKFVLNGAEKQMETVLTAEQAAVYTMDYTLGDWSATAKSDATQAECEKEASQFEPDAIYLVEGDGQFAGIIKGSEFMDRFAVYDGVNYMVRKANARGGFGNVAGEEEHEDITNTEVSNNQVTKMIRDGQVIILRDGKEFNMLGAEL